MHLCNVYGCHLLTTRRAKAILRRLTRSQNMTNAPRLPTPSSSRQAGINHLDHDNRFDSKLELEARPSSRAGRLIRAEINCKDRKWYEEEGGMAATGVSWHHSRYGTLDGGKA